MKYNFYYDESEHSRKINYSTITSENYYDNFMTVIVGWSSEKEAEIERKYIEFENKYAERKKKNELKSDTFKFKQFCYGFASFNTQNIEMLEDLLSIIDKDFYIYLSTISKIEYVVLQLLEQYSNMSYKGVLFVDMDAIKYSIVKLILTYHPKEVLEGIYNNPDEFVDRLKLFFTERLEKNKKNLKLKERENDALRNILLVLNDIEPLHTLEWDYHIPFLGFDKFLKSNNIKEYSLIIDQEGENKKTLNAAKEIGLKNVCEMDSKAHFGIRIADMLAGIVGKMMKSLYQALHKKENNDLLAKNLLDKRWFSCTEKQLGLYKKLYQILIENDHNPWKINAGNYSDDIISLLALLEFMNHFKNVEEIIADIEMQPEYCNTCMCHKLGEHFQNMSNKISIEPLIPETEQYFRNSKGAKVYFDDKLQPLLLFKEGENKFYVISVGISKNVNPVVTISNKGENVCYRLPSQLKDWAETVIALANMGENFFPTEVIFTKIHGQYFADIL